MELIEERTASLLETPMDTQEDGQPEQGSEEETQGFSMGGMSDG